MQSSAPTARAFFRRLAALAGLDVRSGDAGLAQPGWQPGDAMQIFALLSLEPSVALLRIRAVLRAPMGALAGGGPALSAARASAGGRAKG